MKKMPLVLYQIITFWVALAGFSYLFLAAVTFYLSKCCSDELRPLSAILLSDFGFNDLASLTSFNAEICIETALGVALIGLWAWLINRKR